MIRIEYQGASERSLRILYGGEVVKKAKRSAFGKLATKVRSVIAKGVSKRYVITQANVNRHGNKRFVPGTDDVVLSYVGRRIGLINFGAKEKRVKVSPKGNRYGKYRKRVTVKIKKTGTRKPVTGFPGVISPGFIATGKEGNRHVFARTSSARFPIISLKTLAIPQMINEEVIKEAEAAIGDNFPKLFSHAMDFYLSKLK